MKINFYFYVVLFILMIFVVQISNASAQTVCTDLPYDLYAGLADSPTDHSVFQLQTYLKSVGYLSAIPNGYFGPATFAGVKQFQTAHGISSTGRVGPLTRSALRLVTCTAAATTPVQTSSPVTITSPASGSTITIGTTETIRWDSAPSYMYTMKLETPSGAGAGFISPSTFTTNSPTTYSWRVGRVFSTATNDYQNVATGTYRIRISSASGNKPDSDLLSGWFTLAAPPLSVISLTPSSAANDSNTTVVIYGSGFDASTQVRFDSEWGTLANRQYVSPDGVFILFTIPTYVSSGLHQVYVYNSSYHSRAAALNIMVTNKIQ
ncbi:MAG TPA: peptidoglycan-binding domain-containing protein [Candidatus Paceibacterota bacterium]|jgi:peptidoglycan hydrolase-like protein with peptidoglycan-binding domain|nr:peptidoglycan-binding domain-containing protein [Candidatus Paceibacterota bacterium]